MMLILAPSPTHPQHKDPNPHPLVNSLKIIRKCPLNLVSTVILPIAAEDPVLTNRLFTRTLNEQWLETLYTTLTNSVSFIIGCQLR